jgi:hypothetical protein
MEGVMRETEGGRERRKREEGICNFMKRDEAEAYQQVHISDPLPPTDCRPTVLGDDIWNPDT